MTRGEAIRQLDGADAMLMNRDFKKFNQAVIMAINALREQEERSKGCEFCNRFDFTSAKIEVNKYGAHICLATAGTVFATNERLKCCPNCGRNLEVE